MPKSIRGLSSVALVWALPRLLCPQRTGSSLSKKLTFLGCSPRQDEFSSSNDEHYGEHAFDDGMIEAMAT